MTREYRWNGERRWGGFDTVEATGLSSSMGWFIFTVVVILLVAFYLMGGKNYVCIRRKDCCGMGCGCLFPKKAPDPLEANSESPKERSDPR